MQQINEKTLIGWRELVDLPEWDLFGLYGKADTGARSSAIDIDHLEELPGDRVRFEVVASRKLDGYSKMIEADIARRSRVRSSLGDDHARIFVETTVRLAGQSIRAEVGLVSRKHMISRMLLGRRCLDGVFVVDPSLRYLHGRRVQRESVNLRKK